MTAIAVVTASSYAAVFSATGVGGAIPDNNTTGLVQTASFAGPAGSITGITSVTLFNLTHTWIGDVRAHVEFGGQRFTLFQRPGTGTFGMDGNFNLGTYVFDVVSSTTVESFGAAATNRTPGNYRAAHQVNETALTVGANSVLSSGAVWNGMDPNGTFTLVMVDGAGGDTGSVGDWTVEGTYNAVPEPATMAVLGLGAAALLRRRRK